MGCAVPPTIWRREAASDGVIGIKIHIDYGKQGMAVELDPSWNVDILTPAPMVSFEDPVTRIVASTKNPLGTPSLESIIERKAPVKSVCIVVSDATRPVPSHHIIEALVRVLRGANIDYDRIAVLIATGLHRRATEEDFDRILGPRLRNRIRVLSHDARNMDELRFLGTSQSGIPVYINKNYVESDLRILTGYVEPHFFFGFSGGSKSIVPGIAGHLTIQGNHSAENMASPHARFGVYDLNPLARNSLEIARTVGTDFVVNVCINKDHEIVEVAAGELEAVHVFLVHFQKERMFRSVERTYDIVICGNGGFPLDLNLYQSVKSMALGEIAVKKHGTIISVNECSEGIGVGHGEFRNLLFSGMVPEEITRLIRNKEITMPDQWQIQVLARVIQKAEVIAVSRLGPEELGNIGLGHATGLREAIERSLTRQGADAHILILPNGPQVIPFLR